VPDTPTQGPRSDASETNEFRICVLYGPLLESLNGGSPILSYDLQIDTANSQGFHSLIGGENMENSLETRFIVEEGISKGKTFRFRYRSLNINGWS